MSEELTMMAHLLRGEYMAFAVASEAVGADPARSAAGIDAIFSAAVSRALGTGVAAAGNPTAGGLPAATSELAGQVRAALGPEGADIDANLTAALIAGAVEPAAPACGAVDPLTVTRTKVLLIYGIAKHLDLSGDGVETLLRAHPAAA